MRTLSVYLREDRVGELEQDDSGLLRFTYASEWLENDDAMPISRMLPLAVESYEGNLARPFFAGVLPEERPRVLIAEILGISERNDFAMLERIGGECAGAISLLPEDMPPPHAEDRCRTLDEPELESIVTRLPRRPLLAGEDGLRLSLAGAQDKLPVIMDGDAISLPLGSTPSTHIIKPEPERFPGLVANEILCMRLAAAVGLSVPDITRRIVGQTPCTVVTRYDRACNESGLISRLHQEDFCQALGSPPERKYQQEGGPLVRDCVTLLREWSTTPVLDIRAFVDCLIFNMLIGNADAHAKNYSMVYRADERRLAPFYDLVCTIAWPDLSTRLAMNIGNGKNVNDVNPDHFKKMAEEADLGWPMVRERMQTLSGNIIETLAEGQLMDTAPASGMAASVSDLVTQRCRRMLSRVGARG